MSLSARIVLRPSRFLAVCESSVAIGGLAVAACALVARWPAWGWAIAIVALAGALWSFRRTTCRPGTIVVVSDRPEVGLMGIDEEGPVDDAAVADAAIDDGRSWRLAEGTMVWPGLSVLALASDGRTRRPLPVLDRDLDHEDRRALHRFLLWTLRGGAGSRTADA